MKHRILLKHMGENWTTSRTPVAEILSEDGRTITGRLRQDGEPIVVSLDEEKTVCMSSDNDMLTTTAVYETAEVDLPEWMTPLDYVHHHIEWKYWIGFGALPEWPRDWFLKLKAFGEANRYAMIQLLKVKKFRSTFRQSLRAQLEAWLADPKPQYESPFSSRQWGALLNGHVRLEADRISKTLYWQR